MKNENIAEKLLRGSRNVDRMKSEVHQLVKMVIGFAHRSNARWASVREINETFENESCLWTVKGTMGSLDRTRNQLHVRCQIKVPCAPPHETHFVQFVGYCSEEHVPFRSESVQQVYKNLHVFVDGMIRVIPEIKDEMRTFLDASEMF